MSDVFDYGPIRSSAIGLIKKFGRQLGMTLLVPVQATPTDPSKPWRVGDGTITSYPFIGIYIPAKLAVRLGAPVADQSQCTIIMPGDVGTEPIARKHRVQITGTIGDQTDPVYSVSEVERIDPDGTPIAFKCSLHAWGLEVPEGSAEF